MKNSLKKAGYCLFLLLASANQALAKFEEVEPKEKKPTADLPINFEIIDKGVTFLFAVVFIASLFGFLIAGIKFITSGGSEGSLESAHNTWRASLIGLVMSLIGYIMLNIIKFIFFQ